MKEVKLDRDQVRESRRAYLALNRLEAEERRNESPAEKWRQLGALQLLLKELGRDLRGDDDEVVRLRWIKIKDAARGKG